jgi:hypothetical protein
MILLGVIEINKPVRTGTKSMRSQMHGLGTIEQAAETHAADLMRGLHECVRPSVARLRQQGLQAYQIGKPRVPGSTSKYLAYDQQDRLTAVVICSAPEEPDVVSRAVARARLARLALGSLGDIVLEPTRHGLIDGLSYAVFPYCCPLSGSRYTWRLQRVWIRPKVLKWLREATKATCYSPTIEEQEAGFRAPLENLASLTLLPSAVRTSASLALRRLRDGLWVPKHCLMHGDLWKNNILLAPGRRRWERLVLIDWAGSLVRGYGIMDLLTVAPSMRLRGARLRSEVEAHCRILGCELIDARSNLLAALGYIEKHRGYFPWDRYEAMTIDLLQLLDSIGG